MTGEQAVLEERLWYNPCETLVLWESATYPESWKVLSHTERHPQHPREEHSTEESICPSLDRTVDRSRMLSIVGLSSCTRLNRPD
jgi:hypothetical protein